jgi:hypothetical protein
LGSPFAYGYRGTQNGWELLSHPPYSLDLAPSDCHLFGFLKDHLRGHLYETDEAVQEAVRSWLRGAGTGFYHRNTSKILQRWQKCTDLDGDFVMKVITFVFVCITSFHCRINVLITFGTTLVNSYETIETYLKTHVQNEPSGSIQKAVV